MATRSRIIVDCHHQQSARLCSARREVGEHCELHSLLIKLGEKNTSETSYMEGTT
jgi:hypothetical protein